MQLVSFSATCTPASASVAPATKPHDAESRPVLSSVTVPRCRYSAAVKGNPANPWRAATTSPSSWPHPWSLRYRAAPCHGSCVACLSSAVSRCDLCEKQEEKHTLLSARLLNLVGHADAHKAVVGLKLLHGRVAVVEEGEAGRLAATVLGAEAEDGDLVLADLVQLGELVAQGVLGDVGTAGVEDVTVGLCVSCVVLCACWLGRTWAECDCGCSGQSEAVDRRIFGTGESHPVA